MERGKNIWEEMQKFIEMEIEFSKITEQHNNLKKNFQKLKKNRREMGVNIELSSEEIGRKRSETVFDLHFFMRLAPSAVFPMGINDDGLAKVEYPFWIAETPVTYELWYKVKDYALKDGYFFSHLGHEGNGSEEGCKPSSRKKEPVACINWIDAIVWCNALSHLLNRTPLYMYNNLTIKDYSKVKSLKKRLQKNLKFFPRRW